MTASSVAGHFFAVPVDFRIALARIRFSYHLLVQLHADDVTGIGEGVLYRTFPDQVADLFRRVVLPAVEGDDFLSSSAAEQAAWLAQLAAGSPALSYAVDTALWDLRAKKAGKALVDLLGGKRRRHVPITEQVFIRDWPTAEEELDGILSRGTRRIKVKIGTSPQADLEALRRVRAFVGPGVEIRVDANHAYTLSEGEPLYRALADLGVLALEEPLSLRDWPSLQALRQRLGLAVMLDESILSLGDLQAAIAQEAIDVLNVKLTRVGGISQALRYAEVCSQHGVEVALGCSEELGVGTATIVHLAAALPKVHSVEGLGPQRLGFDLIAEQWALTDGMLACPESPGLGVTLPAAWANQLPHGIRCFNLSAGGARLRIFSHYARWFQRANNLLWRAQRRRNR
jgi:L-alanine-DL-glutamate epimerase-like enolase superfamily enzyme